MGKLTRSVTRIAPIPEHQISCDFHKEKAQFFCCHCQKTICDLCTTEEHFDHTFQSLEKVLGEKDKKKKTNCDKSVAVSVKDIEKTMAELEIKKEKK